MMTRVFAAAVLLAAAGTAQAYELLRVNHNSCARNDQNLYWASAGVPVSVAALDEPYHGLAIEAWGQWNSSVNRFRFRAGNGPPCTRDGVAAIAIADQPCGTAAFGDALAITRSVWNDDGTLVDADVTFKSDTFVLDDNDIFRQVAMHELGHVLGLDHSDACGASGVGTLMKSVLSGPVLDAPQADDIDGANAVYPGGNGGGGGDGTVPPGANSCAVVAPQHGDLPVLPWAAIPFLLLWRRMRRRN